MRSIIVHSFLIILLIPQLNAQDLKKGFEFNFSLIHPVKWSLEDYQYSLDPTLELLYFTSISQNILVSGGLFGQAGKHNWLEFYGHTLVGEDGMPIRVRTYYSRQLEFISPGISLKLEKKCNNPVFNSLFMGFTAGKHIKLSMADYLHSKFVAGIETNYNPVFWELNLGFRKYLYHTDNFAISLTPIVGYRNQYSKIEIGSDNYFFYGLGLSSGIGI